jgi:hypothetical protein
MDRAIALETLPILSFVIPNPCSETVKETDHKRTICSLIGFDSGKVKAGMQVLDSSDPNGTFNAWSGGIVTASRRGVALTYVKTNSGGVIYDSFGVPSGLPIVFEYKACQYGSTKIRTNTVNAGGFITNGTLQFVEYLPICL